MQHACHQSSRTTGDVRVRHMRRTAGGQPLPAETHQTVATSYCDYERQPDVESDVIVVDRDAFGSISSVEISLNDWSLDPMPSDDADGRQHDRAVYPIGQIISDCRAAVVDGAQHPAGCGNEEPVAGRRRNARERDRVRTINSTFARLRQKLPQAAAYIAASRSTVESTASGASATTVYRARKLSKVSGLD